MNSWIASCAAIIATIQPGYYVISYVEGLPFVTNAFAIDLHPTSYDAAA